MKSINDNLEKLRKIVPKYTFRNIEFVAVPDNIPKPEYSKLPGPMTIGDANNPEGIKVDENGNVASLKNIVI